MLALRVTGAIAGLTILIGCGPSEDELQLDAAQYAFAAVQYAAEYRTDGNQEILDGAIRETRKRLGRISEGGQRTVESWVNDYIGLFETYNRDFFESLQEYDGRNELAIRRSSDLDDLESSVAVVLGQRAVDDLWSETRALWDEIEAIAARDTDQFIDQLPAMLSASESVFTESLAAQRESERRIFG